MPCTQAYSRSCAARTRLRLAPGCSACSPQTYPRQDRPTVTPQMTGSHAHAFFCAGSRARLDVVASCLPRTGLAGRRRPRAAGHQPEPRAGCRAPLSAASGRAAGAGHLCAPRGPLPGQRGQAATGAPHLRRLELRGLADRHRRAASGRRACCSLAGERCLNCQ